MFEKKNLLYDCIFFTRMPRVLGNGFGGGAKERREIQNESSIRGDALLPKPHIASRKEEHRPQPLVSPYTCVIRAV